MATRNEQVPTDEAALRFQLGAQSSRLLVQSLMAAVAAIGWTTGLLEFDIVRGAAAYLIGAGSTFVIATLCRRAARRGRPLPPAAIWMTLDVLLITWTVWIIRDQYPLWLIWYLISTTSAAFVAGRRAAHVVMAGSCVAYLGVLVGLGRITGFDHELALALGRLALLFGGTYFMIRGIADLRERKLQVAALHAEKTAQLEQLQRLAIELDRRGTELVEANRRTQEANRAKSQFLANMSHELRTPLNSIIGFSEILSERLAGKIEPRFERFLHNVLGSGRHLLGLINDILDLSKIEAGKMEMLFEPLSLSDLVRGVDSVMHSIAAKREIAIELVIEPELPPVVADGPRVKQILYNLLSNAVKFAPERSTVTARVHRLPAERSPIGLDSVVLEVEDRGPGIRSEDRELIFDEFRQVDGQTSRNTGGTGLGLALVKRFAEMHGGAIEVDSELGRGSLFRVVLPLDAAAAGARRATGEPVSFGFRVETAREALAEAGAPLVVVAEDDPEFFAAFAAELEAAGYLVERAERGDEAIEKIRALRPDAVVLDLVLPVRDGWEVLKELKSAEETAQIPVLIVSVVPDQELGLALGADDYFLKPLDRERFLDRLRELVPADTAARPRVLVVDDDPLVHEYLGVELEEAGFLVRSAFDGRSGIAVAVAERPEVIVLDLVMDDMDGFRVALELQSRPETEHVPIVVFTSKELGGEERKQLAELTAVVLSKAPEDRRRLPAVLRELESRRQRRGQDAARVGGRG
ncbi:MAG TPA: response regulator [Thermoanaerobaculia bacterium]|nr:response regulator [Thermoanaerobaculia bacterium]